MTRSNRRARDFDYWWGDLAQYNSEVARGIMHTPEWKAKMAKKQEVYTETYLTHGVSFTKDVEHE